jgi:hypothetical protein
MECRIGGVDYNRNGRGIEEVKGCRIGKKVM